MELVIKDEYSQEELDYIHKMALKKNKEFRESTKGSYSIFLYEFNHCPEAFLENCGVKINYYDNNYLYEKLTFDCWNGDYIKGYVNPKHFWNGWSMPYLTIEGVEQFNKMQDKHLKDEKAPRFEMHGEMIIYSNGYDEEDREEIYPTFINGIKVYDCSLGLCWWVKD